MIEYPLSQGQIAAANAIGAEALEDEYDSLGRQLARRGLAIDQIKAILQDEPKNAGIRWQHLLAG